MYFSFFKLHNRGKRSVVHRRRFIQRLHYTTAGPDFQGSMQVPIKRGMPDCFSTIM